MSVIRSPTGHLRSHGVVENSARHSSDRWVLNVAFMLFRRTTLIYLPTSRDTRFSRTLKMLQLKYDFQGRIRNSHMSGWKTNSSRLQRELISLASNMSWTQHAKRRFCSLEKGDSKMLASWKSPHRSSTFRSVCRSTTVNYSRPTSAIQRPEKNLNCSSTKQKSSKLASRGWPTKVHMLQMSFARLAWDSVLSASWSR